MEATTARIEAVLENRVTRKVAKQVLAETPVAADQSNVEVVLALGHPEKGASLVQQIRLRFHFLFQLPDGQAIYAGLSVSHNGQPQGSASRETQSR